METGYCQSQPGRKSSSRLTGFIVVMIALVFAQEVLYIGRADVIAAATAAGILFITIAGPAMAFLFAQKRNELNASENDLKK